MRDKNVHLAISSEELIDAMMHINTFNTGMKSLENIKKLLAAPKFDARDAKQLLNEIKALKYADQLLSSHTDDNQTTKLSEQAVQETEYSRPMEENILLNMEVQTHDVAVQTHVDEEVGIVGQAISLCTIL